MRHGIPAVIAGQLSGSIGHQGALVRRVGHNQVEKFRRRIAFDVELGCHDLAQGGHIVEPDMALIGPGMHCNTLGAKCFAILRYLNEVGQIASARISQQCHFIDVDGKPYHFLLSLPQM